MKLYIYPRDKVRMIFANQNEFYLDSETGKIYHKFYEWEFTGRFIYEFIDSFDEMVEHVKEQIGEAVFNSVNKQLEEEGQSKEMHVIDVLSAAGFPVLEHLNEKRLTVFLHVYVMKKELHGEEED